MDFRGLIREKVTLYLEGGQILKGTVINIETIHSGDRRVEYEILWLVLKNKHRATVRSEMNPI